ncbi:amylo-alpha-1,6-glucosidase [Candidatus Amarolinea dominans]|uniref:amylo-alpha-1,6-glucosidase n=1 Tax=Candidatus Amarolinea dominans TaxID=3140696 RepID=UPI0031CCD7E1
MADEPAWIQQLTLAADQFIVALHDGHTVIAGYPWFTDWGRDTMIALPGLALSTGRQNWPRRCCALLPVMSIRECCPIASPTRARRWGMATTTRWTPRCGISRPCARL